MHVALVGPCSPSFLAALLEEGSALDAERYPGFGGVPVAQLALGLIESGHRVTVVTTGAEDAPGYASFCGPGLTVESFGRRPSGRAIRDLYKVERARLAAAIRDAAPDIVHAQWTYEFELAAQDSGLPHVTTARDAPWMIARHTPDAYRLARLGVAWRARPGIEHLIVASPYMLTAWRRRMLYRREIQVIPNMVPSLPVVDVEKTPEPTVICVADAGPRKNVEVLVHAFRQVRAALPGARLRLLGFGLGVSDPLARRLRACGLADGVEFLGQVGRQELAEQIASAWCLVHPSLEESFGNTLVEAMILGTPVIGGRDSGAVPWVLDHGRAGELVDVRSEAEIATALVRRLATGPAQALPRARELVQTRYSPQSIIQLHVIEYERCVA